MDRDSLVLSGPCPASGSDVHTAVEALTPEGTVAKHAVIQKMVCHSSYRGRIQTSEFKQKAWRLLIAVKNTHVADPTDAVKWVELMNRAGFPCHWLDENQPYASGYVGQTTEIKIQPFKDGEYVGAIALHNKEYDNGVHFWVALTAVRYIAYQWDSSYRQVPYVTSLLYREVPELDAYQALILAHMVQCMRGDRPQSSHGVTYEQPTRLLTVEQARKRFADKAKESKWSCNAACGDAFATLFTDEMQRLTLANKYQELYKLFL